MLRSSKTMALVGVLLCSFPVFADECSKAYDEALINCREPLSEEEFISLNSHSAGHAEAERVSERLLIKVQDKVLECAVHIDDCARLCHETATIVERVGGYAEKAREFYDKSAACENGGEVHQYFAALEALRQSTLELWQGAEHNAQLVKSLEELKADRTPAQSVFRPSGPPVQVLPSTLDAPTNPQDYTRQVERALEYLE